MIRTDIIDMVGFTDQTFTLQSRQELSRSAAGITYGKDFGPALWTVSYTTGPLRASNAVRFEAALNSLDGVINLFEAHDIRHPYPSAYPDGAFDDSGKIGAVTDGKISLKDLPANFQITAGDYVSFDVGDNRVLHQFTEDVTANASGVTDLIDMRPHAWPGTAVDTPVRFKKAAGYFALAPNSLSSKNSGALHSVISFQAGQIIN